MRPITSRSGLARGGDDIAIVVRLSVSETTGPWQRSISNGKPKLRCQGTFDITRLRVRRRPARFSRPRCELDVGGGRVMLPLAPRASYKPSSGRSARRKKSRRETMKRILIVATAAALLGAVPAAAQYGGGDGGYGSPRMRMGGSLCVTSRGSCPTRPAPHNAPCGCDIPGFGFKRGAVQ